MKTDLDPIVILGRRRTWAARARILAHSVTHAPWRALGPVILAGVAVGALVCAFWAATS